MFAAPPSTPFAVELRPIASIRPYPDNPRDNAVDAVANSIRTYGWRQPIVVDRDGVIVVGHPRYKAAVKLGLVEVPVHIAYELTPAQAKAYRLADNQTATLATWDDDKLAAELLALQELDFDLGLTGSSADELSELLAPEPNEFTGDSDDVPEPPVEPITLPGDLWLLGRHRLLCGDSTKAADVERLMAGATADMVLSDPPYGVSYVGKTKDALTVENDALDEEGLTALVSAAFDLAEAHCRPGAYWYATVPAGPLHLLFAQIGNGAASCGRSWSGPRTRWPSATPNTTTVTSRSCSAGSLATATRTATARGPRFGSTTDRRPAANIPR